MQTKINSVIVAQTSFDRYNDCTRRFPLCRQRAWIKSRFEDIFPNTTGKYSFKGNGLFASNTKPIFFCTSRSGETPAAEAQSDLPCESQEACGRDCRRRGYATGRLSYPVPSAPPCRAAFCWTRATLQRSAKRAAETATERTIVLPTSLKNESEKSVFC